jgi:hypothetical protein
MTETYSKVLFVEGKSEKFTIPELLVANGIAPWKENGKFKVDIRDCEGFSHLVDRREIAVRLKQSGLQNVGVIFDADQNPENQWRSVKEAYSLYVSGLPEELPNQGLVIDVQMKETESKIKFGIWMMPDNRMTGYLETFLSYLITEKNLDLWEFAKKATISAKALGAGYKDSQCDKANIHTWLAWQDEPGYQLHVAIRKKQILDCQHPNALNFVNWFKHLFELE